MTSMLTAIPTHDRQGSHEFHDNEGGQLNQSNMILQLEVLSLLEVI
jgi:hypothetical protein